jgi:carboxymethylenebutenolidase
MALVETTPEMQAPDGPIGLAVKYPEADGPLPTIVLFHHGPGLDEATHEAMRRIAARGFLVAAPDRYRRLGRFTSFAIHRPDGSFDPAVMPLARSALLNTTDDMVAADLAELMRFLSSHPHARVDHVGIVGYCVGVRSMLFAMSAEPRTFVAGVGFHPSFCVDAAPQSDGPTPDGPTPGGILASPSPGPVHVVKDIDGELLLFIGTADQIASAELNGPLIAAVEAKGERGRVEFVDGGDHGFALAGPAWRAVESADAYDQAITFLEHVLGSQDH